jgi:2-methylcitrate dehydratase PrpD
LTGSPALGGVAAQLAEWVTGFRPGAADLALAQRSLLDTVAVTLAARDHPLRALAHQLPEAGRWAAVGHVLDFDDLHMESTAHVSVVCVPAALSSGGGALAYLAAAGVMARLGALLGWAHYQRGWHTTCTAGASAAAVAAAVSRGFSPDQIAMAIALAIPAAGGVQRAFGSSTKALQVGFATSAGVRAADLVAAGASSDPAALDDWLAMVSACGTSLAQSAEAVPGGLAIKLFPCCYALQRPISAMREFGVPADQIAKIAVRTSESSVQPLIHHKPATGLQAKFSLEYGIAAAVLDGHPGFSSFEDDAVHREQARQLADRVTVTTTPGGDGLLAGDITIEVTGTDGSRSTRQLSVPPGAPNRPPSEDDLRGKLAACGNDVARLLEELTWDNAAALMREQLSEPVVQVAALENA